MRIRFKLEITRKFLITAAFAVILAAQPCFAAVAERVFSVPPPRGPGLDDTASVQAVLDVAAAAFNSPDAAGYSGVAVVFPAGTYLITNRLTMTTANFPLQGGGITIRGVDTLQTVIQSKGSKGAFCFKLGGQRTANKFLRLQIEDIKLFANSSSAGPAIEIEPDGTGMTLGIRPMLRNLHINRTTTANSYTYGIKLKSTNRAMFDNVRVYSSQTCDAGFQINESYAYNMIDCTVDGANYGLRHVVGGEGGLVNRCTFTNVNIGVCQDYDPWNFYMSLSDGKILNSSISAKQYGAKIKARNDFFISNNDFYSEAGAGASTNVELTGCSEVFVTGNRFQGGGTARTGVSLLSLKVVSRYCGAQTLISDNIFGVGGTIGTGVSVGANMVETMIFSNTLNTATAYVDNGIGTRFVAGAPDPFVSPAAAGDNENFSWGGIQGTVCNVKSFGATGNGYDDDTTFIKKAAAQAVTYLNNGCKAVLYFPAGTYKLNQRIDLVLNTGCATNLMIYGDGMGVSVIERYPGTTPTGVFNVIVPSTVRVDIHNLMLVARYANAGTGIYVKASRIPASGPSLYMHNILIANRGGANYFNPSIQLENLCDPFFQKVRIEMLNGDFSNATGVKITGGKGFSCEHSTLAGQLGVGLDIMNSLGGDILIKSSMEFGLGAVTNAKINAGGGRFAVDGAHMNCIERNADITNAAGGVSWVNSLTLNHDFNRGAGRADMRLASCKNVRIRNNHFNAGGHGGVAYGYNMDRRAIWLAGAANTNVIVYGNLFAECGAASIYSDAGWIGPKLRFNRFTRTDIADEAGPVSECTRAYELNGLIGEDYLIRNKASGKYLTATNTSASSTTCVETNIGDDVLWNVVYDRLSNQYLLTNKKVGKMLKRNGTDVECSGTVNDTSTQWYIWKQADDYYTLKNTQGTAYLTRAGNEVNCNSTVVGDTNKWEMILAYDLIMGMERKSLNVPNNSWREVRFEKHFEHAPAVFASLGGSANAWPLTVRVTNVTTTSFWLQTQDWESKDNTSHSDEELTYIAMQKGRYDYKGRKVEAGTIPGVGTGWTTRPFEVPFAAPPVVFAQCTSCLGPATVCTRITNVTATSFQIKIQSQSGTHSSEAVDFIAIDPGTCPYFEVGRTTGVTGSWPVPPPSLSFVSAGGWPNAGFAGSVQTFNDSDPCTLRYNLYSITKTNIAVKVDDPNVDDPNGAHGAETVGWMVFETR